MFDFNSLTGNELSLIEDLSGASIARIGDTERPMIKGLYALALVVKRREGNPTLKFNDVLALPLSEINDIVGLNEDVEETEEEGEGDASEPSETA